MPDGSLGDWIVDTFGASSPRHLDRPIGTVVDGVWRPGLYWESQIWQALDTNEMERRGAEQALYVLVEKLNDLLLYVEPEGPGLDAYGPRCRELLILACTEVENGWTQYMRRGHVTPSAQGYSTRDYVRLV